jgi:hypothetical protein
MVRAFRVVLAVCTLTATASLLAQTSPQLTVGTDRVTVTGVTAHADVVFFARSVTYRGGVPVLARHAFIERDEDGDGTVTHVEAVPALSVWVTVDVESGAFAYAAPAGFEPKVILLPPGTWRENDGAVNVSRERVDFLFVRPRKGAWLLDVFQGSVRDEDGRNDANLRIRTASMAPLTGKESPPPHPVKKDVLVLIDPRLLEVAIVAAE